MALGHFGRFSAMHRTDRVQLALERHAVEHLQAQTGEDLDACLQLADCPH